MKDKINALIVECLGELPNEDRTSIGMYKYNRCKHQKRELLAGLIEDELELGRWPNINNSCNVRLIEKHLKMKWPEIIKYLEGGEGK